MNSLNLLIDTVAGAIGLFFLVRALLAAAGVHFASVRAVVVAYAAAIAFALCLSQINDLAPFGYVLGGGLAMLGELAFYYRISKA